MIDRTQEIQFKAGETIFDAKTPLPTAYFILKGRVDLELTLNGEIINLEICENHFLGDAAVAVAQKAEGSTVSYRGKAVALDEVTAVLIPIEDIKQELEACPPLLKAWFASFINRILIITDKLSIR